MALSPLEEAALAAYTPAVAQDVGASLAAQYPNGVANYSAPGTGPAYDENMVYRFDTGNKIQVPDGKGGWVTRNAAPVVFQPGQKYVLASKDGTNILGEASTPEELQELIALSDANKSDWDLYRANPSGDITPGAQLFGRHPVSNLPLYLIGAGMLAATGAGALGLGAGGGGAGGLSGITGASAGNAALASLANVPIAAGLPATTAGLGAGVSAIGGAAGAGGGAIGGGATLGGVGFGTSTTGLTPIVVPGIKGGLTFAQTLAGLAPGVGIPGATAALGGGTPPGTGPSTTAGLDDIIEVAGKPGVTAWDKFVLPAINTAVTVPSVNVPSVNPPTTATETTGTDPIKVVGQPVKPYIPPITIPPVFTDIPPVNAPELPTDLGSPELPGKTGPKVPWGRIISGVLGGLGGASGSGSTPYLGTGARDPIFSAKLPPSSLPGGVSSMSARPVPEQNWYEYGFHPEQSFFNTSAPGYTPEPGKTPGMARGGDFAVRGPGTGRSDSIDAKLSDGEYVMDAETVALLGDGSSKAGAQKLDRFRVNVRKHKGRDLARGKFSVKAKMPEAYMAGGHT